MGAQGTATIDFGVFPGKSDASVAVTGQTGIASGSLVEAWMFPVATGDHTADEHLVETIRVTAGNIVAGTGFTIYAFNTNQLVEDDGAARSVRCSKVSMFKEPMIYGQWTVAWVWN